MARVAPKAADLQEGKHTGPVAGRVPTYCR